MDTFFFASNHLVRSRYDDDELQSVSLVGMYIYVLPFAGMGRVCHTSVSFKRSVGVSIPLCIITLQAIVLCSMCVDAPEICLSFTWLGLCLPNKQRHG